MTLDELCKLAQSHSENNVKKYRLAAALVNRGEVISYGFNRAKTHPLQARFAVNKDAVYLHAEIDAIVNAFKSGYKIDDLSKSTLMIARVLKNGSPGLAKPCQACQKAIIHFNIRNVIYTE